MVEFLIKEDAPSIPCLPGLPFFGNIFDLRNPLHLLLRISQEFGEIGAFHFGLRLVPLLNAPEMVREILAPNAPFEKTTTVRKLGEPVLGKGLFLSEGEEHREQRRLMAPLFQHSHVLNYGQTIIDCTTRMQETWVGGATIDLADEMRRLTLWIISQVLFGADVTNDESDLGEVLTYTFQHFTKAITNPLRLPQSWPTPRNRRAHHAIARINAIIYRMIAERRHNSEERNDFLSLLLHIEDAKQASMLSDRLMRDEALSLFVAGHETTANALTWCWYLLSQHPDVYARMKAESDRVLQGHLPTITDLPNLPYALQVWKEALRLYPPAYALTRRAMSPVQIGPYHIPKGTSVVISPYTLHRNARFFPNPERFDPERFAPLHERHLPRYAYLPFGAGPHTCIGMHFALLEGHLILSTLAQCLTFEFSGSAPVEPEPLLTLRPKGAVLMTVRRRSQLFV